MINGIAQKLNLKSLTGRSRVVARNAIISLFLKGFSIALSFVFVPLYLNSVGQRQYGIILTITSISNFISFFDVGIGNGLRSKLGKAIAEKDLDLSRYYVSTSYYYVTIFFSSVFVLYCLVAHWVHWYKVLNIPVNEIANLDRWIFIVVALFIARFVLQLIGSVLLAYQKSFINDSIQFTTSLVTIIVCFALKFYGALNFYTLLLIMCALPVVVLIGYSTFYYLLEYKHLRPSLKFVNHAIRKDLLSLGFKFFLLQIVSLIIFSTTNILIAQLFNMESVTTYNIAFKYYNITVIVFNILISPLWGAFTNAWYQDDIAWIKKNIRLYTLIALLLFAGNILQFFAYPFFIKLWLKRDMAITFALVLSFLIYNFIFCYNNILSYFLASIGHIDKQVYAAVLGGILNVPVTIYLAKYTGLGLSSILFANVICLLPSTIITTIQSRQLIKAGRTIT